MEKVFWSKKDIKVFKTNIEDSNLHLNITDNIVSNYSYFIKNHKKIYDSFSDEEKDIVNKNSFTFYGNTNHHVNMYFLMKNILTIFLKHEHKNFDFSIRSKELNKFFIYEHKNIIFLLSDSIYTQYISPTPDDLHSFEIYPTIADFDNILKQKLFYFIRDNPDKFSQIILKQIEVLKLNKFINEDYQINFINNSVI